MVKERIGFVTSLYGETEEGKVLHAKAAGRVGAASLRVTTPSGEVRNLPMFDDGMHSDGAAGDGIYADDFLAERAGQYLARITVRGTNRNGRQVVRTAEHPLPIVAPSLQLAGTKATATNASVAGRLSLNIPVAAEKSGRHYRGYAEVWGTS